MSISFRFRIVLFCGLCALFPAIIFLGIYIPEQIEDDSTLAWSKLELDSNRLADLMEMKLADYKYLFQVLSPYDQIDEIVEWRKNNASLDEYYESLNSTERIQGDLYPHQINSTQLYQTIYGYFNQIQQSTEGIDLIRIFYRDGNILVGERLGEEDLVDYKGDKSWFSDGLNLEEGSYYVSPISIARRTESPAIRILRPIFIDGEVYGIFVMNFQEEKILEFIYEDSRYNEDYRAFIIDPNYENAEGEILGAVYIANSFNRSRVFQEISPEDIEFNASSLNLSISWYNQSTLIENRVFFFKTATASLDQRIWYVTVAISKDSMYSESTQRLIQNLIIFCLIIGIFSAISMVVSNRLVKPISEITEKAMLLAAGDSTVDFSSHRTDELGELSQAIAHMIYSLQELEFEVKFIINSVVDKLVFFKNKNLDIKWTNIHAQNLGVKIRQTPCYKVIFNLDQICPDCPVLETFLTSKSAERYRITKNEQYWEIRTFPVHDQSKNMIGVLEIIKDITQMKKMEKKLNQSQRLESLGQLAGGIAHDFNNLITVIYGTTELMLADMAEKDPNREMLQAIQNTARSGANLTKQLLAFSRKEKSEPIIVSLNNIIIASGEMLRRTIGQNIEIRLELTDDSCNIYADPGQIEQIILNLVINARDALPSGGMILLKTENIEIMQDAVIGLNKKFVPGKYIQFSISDNGIGMDSEIMEHIFEPFFTTKDPGEGTGLGLSIVYGNVLQNQGDISVYSEVGKGTTFHLFFPSAKTEAISSESISSYEKQLLDALQKIIHKKILLVDDDEQVLEYLLLGLKKYGFSCYSANNGEKALKQLEIHENEIDIVISDVIMPKLGGKELFFKIREKFPQKKVLLISGYLGTNLESSEVKEYNIPLLLKPFTIPVLLSRLLELFENK